MPQNKHIFQLYSAIRLELICKVLSSLQCLSFKVFSFAVSKGRVMGSPLVLVSSCFRENVIVTCKILSFLCSLNNFLLKNVNVFFFGNQVSKWRSFEKRTIFDLILTFLNHKGKDTKLPSAHISLTYINALILLTLLTFLPSKFFKKDCF